MKNILTFGLIVALVVITSCGKDDAAAVTNALVVDGSTFTPSTGVIADLGADESHYSYFFGISDGELTSNGQTVQFSTANSFLLTFLAGSFGTTGFTGGTFEYITVTSATPDSDYFTLGTFLNIDTGQSVQVSGGTITISGSSPNLTLQFDLTLTGGGTLTGSFSGNFEVVSE